MSDLHVPKNYDECDLLLRNNRNNKPISHHMISPNKWIDLTIDQSTKEPSFTLSVNGYEIIVYRKWEISYRIIAIEYHGKVSSSEPLKVVNALLSQYGDKLVWYNFKLYHVKSNEEYVPSGYKPIGGSDIGTWHTRCIYPSDIE